MKIYPDAKGILEPYDITIDSLRHVGTVVTPSHKNADTHINVNVEFGDEEGQILIDRIGKKAEEGSGNKEINSLVCRFFLFFAIRQLSYLKSD